MTFVAITLQTKDMETILFTVQDTISNENFMDEEFTWITMKQEMNDIF